MFQSQGKPCGAICCLWWTRRFFIESQLLSTLQIYYSSLCGRNWSQSADRREIGCGGWRCAAIGSQKRLFLDSTVRGPDFAPDTPTASERGCKISTRQRYAGWLSSVPTWPFFLSFTSWYVWSRINRSWRDFGLFHIVFLLWRVASFATYLTMSFPLVLYSLGRRMSAGSLVFEDGGKKPKQTNTCELLVYVYVSRQDSNNGTPWQASDWARHGETALGDLEPCASWSCFEFTVIP